jgi:hypothetical protein
MAAMVSTVGESLNRTPPPPLTWVSMKPGTSRPPSRSRRVRAGGRGGAVEDRGDPAVLDHDALAVDDAGFRQDAAIYEYSLHQTVSVTLLRWGGLSGS